MQVYMRIDSYNVVIVLDWYQLSCPKGYPQHTVPLEASYGIYSTKLFRANSVKG